MPSLVQGGLRDIGILVLDLGIKWGRRWSHHPQPIYLQERDQVCIVEETSRAPRPVWRVNLFPPPQTKPPSVIPSADFSSSVRCRRTTNLLSSSHKLMTAGVHYYIVTTVLKKYVTGYTPYCKGSIPSPLKPMSPIQLTQSHETPVFDTILIQS